LIDPRDGRTNRLSLPAIDRTLCGQALRLLAVRPRSVPIMNK
jgi:hypothetical protein